MRLITVGAFLGCSVLSVLLFGVVFVVRGNGVL